MQSPCEPPPVQFEVPARKIGFGETETLPAASLGAFVTFDADGRVTALGAPTRAVGPYAESHGYHFHGPLLPELGQLQRLEHLDLGYRQVEAFPAGPTRRQIAAAFLDRNESFPADMGALTGVIPPQLGQLTRLRYLDLQGQLLAEPLPPEIGDLASLEHLHLGSNWLAGPLPPELGQLANLQTFNLGARPYSLHFRGNRSNRLTALPPELGQLTNLRTLDLSSNELTAPPPELGQLANLQRLRLEDNQLTGPLPPGWGQLANLELLYLYNNQLTGPLLLEWTRMSNLRTLDTSSNQLTGCYPGIYFPNLTTSETGVFYVSTGLPRCPSLDYIYHPSRG